MRLKRLQMQLLTHPKRTYLFRSADGRCPWRPDEEPVSALLSGLDSSDGGKKGKKGKKKKKKGFARLLLSVLLLLLLVVLIPVRSRGNVRMLTGSRRRRLTSPRRHQRRSLRRSRLCARVGLIGHCSCDTSEAMDVIRSHRTCGHT